MTCGGTMMVNSTSANSSRLPLNSNRAKPYPTSAQDRIWSSELTTPSVTELRSDVG